MKKIPLSSSVTTNYIVKYRKGGKIDPIVNIRKIQQLNPSSILVVQVIFIFILTFKLKQKINVSIE